MVLPSGYLTFSKYLFFGVESPLWLLKLRWFVALRYSPHGSEWRWTPRMIHGGHHPTWAQQSGWHLLKKTRYLLIGWKFEFRWETNTYCIIFVEWSSICEPFWCSFWVSFDHGGIEGELSFAGAIIASRRVPRNDGVLAKVRPVFDQLLENKEIR